jgi:hypothetical protein
VCYPGKGPRRECFFGTMARPCRVPSRPKLILFRPPIHLRIRHCDMMRGWIISSVTGGNHTNSRLPAQYSSAPRLPSDHCGLWCSVQSHHCFFL